MSNTSDFAKLGSRERHILIDILTAWDKYGLPADFTQEDVVWEFNPNSGYVFLTNEDFQTCMLKGNILSSFYTTPYHCHEGFLEELLAMDCHGWNQEDIDYIKSIVEYKRVLNTSQIHTSWLEHLTTEK